MYRRGVACNPEGRKLFPKMAMRENLLMGTHRDAAGAFKAFRG